MGLKDDLIKAKVECFKIMGKSEDEIDSSVGSALEVEANLMTEAIVNFLTSCQFRITGLVAPVVLEDFNIPPQQGDVLPSVQALGANGGGPVTTNVTNGTNGVLTKAIDVGKDVGGLESTGYVYIGGDPDSQGEFDVSDLDGIRTFTSVEVFREFL